LILFAFAYTLLTSFFHEKVYSMVILSQGPAGDMQHRVMPTLTNRIRL
jgi:hypothetical protein